MAVARIKRHGNTISYLATCPSRTRKILIKDAKPDLIHAIADAAYNIIKNNVSLNRTQIAKLKPYSKEFRVLATKGIPIRRKKKVLSSQKGFGALALISAILAPLLSYVVPKIFSRAAKPVSSTASG